MGHRILLVDDNDRFRQALADNVVLTGRYEVLRASNGETALDTLTRVRDVSCIVLDHDFGMANGKPRMTGLQAMEKMQQGWPYIPIIMISGITEGRGRIAIASIQKSAHAFLDKPFTARELIDRIDALVEQSIEGMDSKAFDALKSVGFVSHTPVMLETCEQAVTAARTEWNVLLVGETGSGKNALARAIHALSPRKDEPFVEVNCGSIPADLFISHLFGHRKGAFANAIESRPGFFEEAGMGSILLDELTEVPVIYQTSLNHAIDFRKYCRVGETQERIITSRIIAATNRNLDEAISQHKLREDLRYRFEQVIWVPPLRERPEDIEVTAQAILEHLTSQPGFSGYQLDSDALTLLRRQPGLAMSVSYSLC